MEFHLIRPDIAILEGFCEIARELSKEMLRCEPENIEEFIADYLELKELATRTKQIWLHSVTFPSIITPELTAKVMKSFESCKMAQEWKFYCINILMQEFGRVERLLISSDLIQEMILSRCVKNVIFNDDGLLNQAMKHCSLTTDETATLKVAYQSGFEQFLATILTENCVQFVQIFTFCIQFLLTKFSVSSSSVSYSHAACRSEHRFRNVSSTTTI